ncbi:MAG: Gldg family protein [Anaerolineae bacterium]|nr:Gldg family protein [Anaerolineae bacterium]
MSKIRIMFKLLCLALLLGISLTVVPVALLQADEPPFAGYQIYFSESNAEASPFDRSARGASRFAGFLQQLGADIRILDWRQDVPADADLVVILGPQRDLGADQIARLWHYLINGGSLLLVLDPLEITTDQGTQIIDATRSLGATRGLSQLLWADFGIRGRDDLLLLHADARAAAVGADAPLNLAQTLSLVSDFTTTNLNHDTPITAGVDSSLAFFGARSVEFDATIQPYETVPLVFAAEGYYGESGYASFLADGLAEFDEAAAFESEALALAVAFLNPTSSTRLIVIGDRDFATNGGGFQSTPMTSADFTYASNIQFLINSVAWLLDSEAPVTIPDIAAASATPESTETAPGKRHSSLSSGFARVQ